MLNLAALSQSTVLALGLCSIVLQVPAANADAISPSIKETTQLYSNEKSNKAFYGTGITGRLSEASALRFQGEQDTHDQNFDTAVRELAKAVQLDQGDPEGHMLYARALSAKIKAGQVNPKELETALHEWHLLWHHDSDHDDQVEAHMEARSLGRIARALDKRMKNEKRLAQGSKPMLSVKGSLTLTR
jgi:hypothetical protein